MLPLPVFNDEAPLNTSEPMVCEALPSVTAPPRTFIRPSPETAFSVCVAELYNVNVAPEATETGPVPNLLCEDAPVPISKTPPLTVVAPE
jgi:hypothetical protein